jgi:hypothetical protein
LSSNQNQSKSDTKYRVRAEKLRRLFARSNLKIQKHVNATLKYENFKFVEYFSHRKVIILQM